MLPYEDYESLPLLYHLNSEPWMNEEAYTDPSCVARFRPVAEPSTAVALPPAETNSPLARLLARRRSSRAFVTRRLSIDVLANLLAHAYGGGAPSDAGGLPRLPRPVPSAGGLYPFDVQASAIDVDGLADGLYRYNVLHHCLERSAARPTRDDLGAHLLAQYFLENANLLFFLVADFVPSLRKYGARGYRYVLMEAGHVAQTLCLAAAQHGLGSLCVGGFRDTGLNRTLGIAERARGIVYCVGVGWLADVPPENVGTPKVE